MSPMVQAKLLRVLQEREFQRLGGTRTLKANVRVITATNRDLMAAIGRGQFREDLYYRLNVFEIVVPPLRERPEDILLLAESFLEELGTTMGRPAAGISRDARDWLLAYPWPGNVRELRNAVQRAALLSSGETLAAEAFGFTTSGSGAPTTSDEEPDRGAIEAALRRHQGVLARAAADLGLSRQALYRRMDKLGIRRP